MKVRFIITTLIIALNVPKDCYSQIENKGNISPPKGTIQIDTINLGHKIYAFKYFNGDKYAYGSSIQEFPAVFEYDSIEFTAYDTIGPLFYEPFIFTKKNEKWGMKVLFYDTWLTGHIFDEISKDMIAGNYFLVRSGNKWGVYDFNSTSLHVDTQFDEIIVDYKDKKNGYPIVYSVYARSGDHYACFDVNLNRLTYVHWANSYFLFSIDAILSKMKIQSQKLNKINFPEDVYKIGAVIGKHQKDNLEFIEVEKDNLKGVLIHDLKMDQYMNSSVFALYDSVEFIETHGVVLTYRNGKIGLFDPTKGMIYYTIYDSILFNNEGEYEAWINGTRDDKTILNDY